MTNWKPSEKIIRHSNIQKMMTELTLMSYNDFWRWSVNNKHTFWKKTVERLGIVFDKGYSAIVDTSKGVENAEWLYGARLNIVDSCFQNSANATAVIVKDKLGVIQYISQKDLELRVNAVANALVENRLVVGDIIAIYMPMRLEAVVIYLAAIKAGMTVATIADSFSKAEVSVRLKITKPKLIFTQDGFKRADRIHKLYKNIHTKKAIKSIVFKNLDDEIFLENGDVLYSDFLSLNTSFTSVKVKASHLSTILFSSGTTGEPKAIPWDHATFIKSASDAYYHHDVHANNVLCWPTNLGWMMGPWLVFATLLNKSAMALYDGSPLEEGFGLFIQNTKVSMLGVVPSIVKSWKSSRVMEKFNWDSIRCFSSTGEVSNPEEMSYLMQLANNKPVIEYCGGTEIGGGYITSTMVQENIPSLFSTQTLGGEFVLLDEKGEKATKGEVFLMPPIMGLSTSLLNRNHHHVYYKEVPNYKHHVLRKHGDEFECLKNGYYRASGRIDDTMNLGGIKIGSVQIEAVINTLDFVEESAAIAIHPKKGGPSELIVYFVGLDTITKQEALKKVQNCVKTKLNPLFKVVDLVKIDNLPRTASKKLKRKELRELYQKL